MPETRLQEDRRSKLRNSPLNGIDEVEVADDRATLIARFFHDAPKTLSRRNLRITGGVAVRGIEVVDVQLVDSDDPDLPTLAEVSLNRAGDASIYELRVEDVEGFDPRYRAASFTFFPEFHDDVDCVGPPASASPTLATPPIDYLAKDYTGFRQLILDRLAVTLPDWRESHIPDIGVMLVEMLAYTADRLSYYQDAVATEAYLGTARRRLSIRRHARLIDYRVHDGASARALVQIEPDVDATLDLDSLNFAVGKSNDATTYFPVEAGKVSLAQAAIAPRFHCWGDTGCVLPKGSRSATLVDPTPDAPPYLRKGDFVIFEVIDAGLGGIPDADLTLRHAVRLTRVERSRDPLLNVDLLEIGWSAEDATPIDFPLDATTDAPGDPGTVARGNLVLVAQGRRVTDGDRAGGQPRTVDHGPGSRRTLTLTTPGLAFTTAVSPHDSAHRVLVGQAPRDAAPMIECIESWPLGAPLHGDGAASSTVWRVQPDLIESGPDDPHVMVEMDDGGVAMLRFGDGVCGRDPAGQGFEIVYRVGVGAAGNVGADSITFMQGADHPGAAGWRVRNPLPASGGAAPEDVAQVRLLAPHVFRDTRARAVTADDYAELAVDLEPEVQRAACDLIRVGGRKLARVAIDPLGRDSPAGELERRVVAKLEPYRHIGHDIVVVQGDYVPLLLVVEVTLTPGYSQGHVRAGLRSALGAGTTQEGGLAPFHPDRLTFGTPIHGSPLVAAAQAVPGVRGVTLVELARLFDRERGSYGKGVLPMAWNEIPRLDDDPLRPDHGRLELRLVGGVR